MAWENIQDIDLREKMKMTMMSPIKNMHTHIMYTHTFMQLTGANKRQEAGHHHVGSGHL